MIIAKAVGILNYVLRNQMQYVFSIKYTKHHNSTICKKGNQGYEYL